jgi:carboxylesterase
VPVLPGAEPFAGGDGPVGVVVVHGFTGSPASTVPWGRHLVNAGYRVVVPRLPGHGTRWQDLARTRWTDWFDEVRHAYDTLTGQCDRVVAAGLSVGGALSLRLAETEPALAGVVVVNPSLATERRDAPLARFLAPLVPSFPGVVNDIARPGQDEVGYHRLPLKAFVSLQDLWRVVTADLGDVTCPVRMFRSRVDHVVEPRSARVLAEGLAVPLQETVLEDSFHVATLDNDASVIFDGTVQFLRTVVAS